LLKSSPEAGEARGILRRRGVSGEMVERFSLGYAPKAAGLGAALKRRGFDAESLLQAGLLVQREDRVREMFWSRLLFPIRSGKGEVIGFGGRVLGEGEPKYLNSRESEYFSKGRVLYGLFEALPALRKDRRAVVLEGYMDVIALHQFGFSNAVAPLGTALTEDHAALLRRWADSVTILFDPDAAGAAAAVKGAELLLTKGFSVAVATVPDGLDPDELLHQRGPEALQALLDGAVDLAEFKTRVLLGRFKGRPGPEEMAKVVAQVLETIGKCPNEVLRSDWVKRLHSITGVDEASLIAQLNRLQHPEEPPALRRRPEKPALRGRLPSDDTEVLLALL
ncbi:MAG: toprim domain-containing protein, partial [Elusimicrobia bacterium]|nr:toprim domain-containing protein [Elusimicrobiota bacterium]